MLLWIVDHWMVVIVYGFLFFNKSWTLRDCARCWLHYSEVVWDCWQDFPKSLEPDGLGLDPGSSVYLLLVWLSSRRGSSFTFLILVYLLHLQHGSHFSFSQKVVSIKGIASCKISRRVLSQYLILSLFIVYFNY